jgi:putative flippase GtrA
MRPENLVSVGKKALNIKFVRFLLVGVINTIVGYGIFALLILLHINLALALFLSTGLGLVFNYFSTRHVVFSSQNSGTLWRFALVYAFIYVANVIALMEARKFGISPIVAQAAMLPFCVLMAYTLNKRFVFRSSRTSQS